jgi:PPM family protein phosphatase
MPLRICSATDIGRRRTSNQDVVLTDAALQLFVIADGMGGHQDGDVASRIVVDGIRQFISDTAQDDDKTWPFKFDLDLSYTANRLKSALLLANRRLADHIAAGAPRGMGATVTAALFGPGRFVIANVGDCRTYLMDEGGFRQVTRDHSWVAEQVEAGFFSPEAARAHPWRHLVTRAVQGDAALLVDTIELATQSGRLLLCSDGLHGAVSDERITTILGEPSDRLDYACQALIEAAHEGGSPDNVSVILVDWDDALGPPEPVSEGR